MLRFLSAGESHGPKISIILEGLPAGIPLHEQDINDQLARRQKGYGRGGRMKIEKDRAVITAGVRSGETTGSPLAVEITNIDERKQQKNGADFTKNEHKITCPRPGHGDLAGSLKYERKDITDISERASARETAARVACGAVILKMLSGLEVNVLGQVLSIGGIEAEKTINSFDEAKKVLESSPLRCADLEAAEKMMAAIDQAKEEGDTLGGVFSIEVFNLPPGLGSFVHWDRRLDGLLAQAVMSIPGVKGVEFGLGFSLSEKRGRQGHDAIYFDREQGFYRKTNYAGGVEAGMSNGEKLLMKAAFKPIPTLQKPLDSVKWDSREPACASVVRSDVCAVPSAAVIAESMSAFVIGQAFLDTFSRDSYPGLIKDVRQYRKQSRQGFDRE